MHCPVYKHVFQTEDYIFLKFVTSISVFDHPPCFTDFISLFPNVGLFHTRSLSAPAKHLLTQNIGKDFVPHRLSYYPSL